MANDVLISGKKVCGILPETRFLGDKMDFAIVGIGVNVAIDTDLLPPLTLRRLQQLS